MWSVTTKELSQKDKQRVGGLKCVKVDAKLKEITGSAFEMEADLVVLALGFLKQDMKEEKGIFLAGDLRLGPSLIVKALADGRGIAGIIDRFVKGE